MDYDPRMEDELFDEDIDDERESRRAKSKKPVVRPILPPLPPGVLSQEQIAGSVITYDDMRRALSKLLQHRGMSQEEINNLAMYLLSFFGFSDAIIDNILDTDDRDVFYMLEEEGILSTSREETYTLKGKVWRIHYWILRKREILMLSRDEPPKEAEKAPGEFSVYDDVDPRVWARED
jgi:hypothetical protein